MRSSLFATPRLPMFRLPAFLTRRRSAPAEAAPPAAGPPSLEEFRRARDSRDLEALLARHPTRDTAERLLFLAEAEIDFVLFGKLLPLLPGHMAQLAASPLLAERVREWIGEQALLELRAAADIIRDPDDGLHYHDVARQRSASELLRALGTPRPLPLSVLRGLACGLCAEHNLTEGWQAAYMGWCMEELIRARPPEEVIRQAYQQVHCYGPLVPSLLRLPAAPPEIMQDALWRHAPGEQPSEFAATSRVEQVMRTEGAGPQREALLRLLVEDPRWLQSPEVRAAARRYPSAEVLSRILPLEPTSEWPCLFGELVAVDPEAAAYLVETDHHGLRAQLSRADLAPLLSCEDSEVRLRAIQALHTLPSPSPAAFTPPRTDLRSR